MNTTITITTETYKSDVEKDLCIIMSISIILSMVMYLVFCLLYDSFSLKRKKKK